VLYVLPFYLSSTTRPSRTLSRDAPSVIRARIRAITLSCIVSTLITVYVLATYDHATPEQVLRLLGLLPINLLAIAQTILLCSVLFIGPLFESAIVERRLGLWIRGSLLRETFGSWIGWRNLVAGPVSEELVFRSLIIPLHLIAKMEPTRIVFITPLYFGIAHIHHFYEFVLTHPEFPILPAIIRTVIQFTYTSLFGFFASFVYLRTGSVYAAIAAHMFCNWQGLPRFWGKVQIETGEPIVPMQFEADKSIRGRSPAPGAFRPKVRKDMTMAYTVVYYVLLFVGAYGFKRLLWSLTESSGGLAHFGTVQEK
jgi:prenyl protein peptidase